MLEERALNRIIEHMNDDHADALLLYVQAFAGHTEATSARLVTFDERGMGIIFSTPDGADSQCRIDFDAPLAHAGEARRVLVEMVDEARARIGGA